MDLPARYAVLALVTLVACGQRPNLAVVPRATATHAAEASAASTAPLRFPPPGCTQVPAPRFTAESWVAPVGIDPAVEAELRATVFGTLDDPREGTLREVSVWGFGARRDSDDGSESRIPWPLPATVRVREAPGARPLGIVGTRVFALESVGPALDIVVGCTALLALARQTSDADDEEGRVSLTRAARDLERAACPGASAAAQLALMGESELANAVMSRVSSSSRVDVAVARLELIAGSLDHAITALIAGDDCLAKSSAQETIRLWNAIQSDPDVAIACRRFEYRRWSRCEFPYAADWLLRGLDQGVARRPAAYTGVPEEGPVSTALALRLVAELEFAGLSQPHYGHSDFLVDAIFRALARAGDSIVPALIALLEEPDRLTRSGTSTDYVRFDDVVTIHDLVRNFLAGRLDVRLPTRRPRQDPFAAEPGDAAILRARFERIRGMSAPEMCFLQFRDSGSPSDWANASECLGGRVLFIDAGDGVPTNDSLRALVNPTVTEVASARAIDALRAGAPEHACTIARNTIAWDPIATPAWLPRFARACRARRDCPCQELLGIDAHAGTPATRVRFLAQLTSREAQALYARAIANPEIVAQLPALRRRVLAALADDRPSMQRNAYSVCEEFQGDPCGREVTVILRRSDDLAVAARSAAHDGPRVRLQFDEGAPIAERDARIAEMASRIAGAGSPPTAQ